MSSVAEPGSCPALPDVRLPLPLRGIEPLVHGAIVLALPDGRTVRWGERTGGAARLDVIRSRALWRGAIGGDPDFGLAYVDGDWDSPDLFGVLRTLAANRKVLLRGAMGHPLGRLAHRFQHWRHRNSRRGSRHNIMAHYDLGNAFYAAWLDPGMAYSSALFETGAETLTDAQTCKYAAMADGLAVGCDDHVLEIGCGWGGFAAYLARERGCRVTGITISPAQAEAARQRIVSEGLTERVEIRLQDYRDIEGQFDAVASIEMFEAVGAAYWPVFFDRLGRALRPGGRCGLQIITIAEDHAEVYRSTADFIQRHVFPGGELPPASAVRRLAEEAGFRPAGERFFGRDYARTLLIWLKQFEAAWPMDGFDETFRRLWRYYLTYCAAGFDAGIVDVGQFHLERS